jgi:mycoredoxin-dependent peroxiredoxin
VTAPAVGGVAIATAAPDFELRDQHAQTHRLSSYLGAKNVVLVFYPFAFTGVCTGELQAIHGELDVLQNERTQVLAISCDPMASLRVFADQHGFRFPLLSDFWPHGAVATAYGVFNTALGAAERGTFIVDTNGVVRWTVRAALGEGRDVVAYQQALAEL